MLEVYLEYLSTTTSEEQGFCVRPSNQGLLLSPRGLLTLQCAFHVRCGALEKPFAFSPLLLLDVSKLAFPLYDTP